MRTLYFCPVVCSSFFPRLISAIADWTQTIVIWAPSHNFVGPFLRNWGTYRQLKKNLLNSNISSTCPHNMANFGPVTAEIGLPVLGTPANFNRFRVLAALLHGTLVVGVSQTLRHWTEGATYIWQGGHYVRHWPTFLVIMLFNYGRPMEKGRPLYFHPVYGRPM